MKKVIALMLVLVLTLVLTGCDSADYKKAMELYEAGNYQEAMSLFWELGDYKDSAEKLQECETAVNYESATTAYATGDYKKAIRLFKKLGDYQNSAEMLRATYIAVHGETIYEKISSLEVGDTVKFGVFEQDNKSETTDEAITWRVLDRKGSSVLLLSEKILAYRCFNDILDLYWANSRPTWGGSSIYNWLNGSIFDKDANTSFYELAFTEGEKAIIIKDNPSDSAKVFLLSKEECEKYFANRFERQCTSTEYARKTSWSSAKGCVCHSVCYEDYWTLRTVIKNELPEWGYSDNHLYIHVDYEGTFSDEKDYERYKGFSCSYAHPLGVRPAIWVSLDNFE